MSTSSDGAATGVIPVVEAFPYQDTFGSSTPSNGAGMYGSDPTRAKAANGGKTAANQEDAARLIAEARLEGIAEGARQAAARFEAGIAEERKRVAETVIEFQRQSAEYYARVENELVHLSLAIAAKILHRESQVDRMVVAGLVKVMLERLQQNTKVVVRVRPEDAKDWALYFRGDTNSDTNSVTNNATNVEIVGDPALQPNACFIETELGVANMALDAQLKEIETGFFDLMAQRPNPK
jgi:flagellar assembly protein FliH